MATLVTSTTFKPETLAEMQVLLQNILEMSVENQELSLQGSRQVLLSLQTLLQTMDQDPITLVTITTMIKMSVENPEQSLKMLLHLGQVLLLTSITILVEMSDQDLITILSTNTLRRHKKSLTGSGRCTTTKKSNHPITIIF